MEKIEGVDLKAVLDGQRKAFTKEAEAAIGRQVHALMSQLHNAKIVRERTATDLAKKDAEIEVLKKRMEAISAGDWGAVEGVDLGAVSKPTQEGYRS